MLTQVHAVFVQKFEASLVLGHLVDLNPQLSTCRLNVYHGIGMNFHLGSK